MLSHAPHQLEDDSAHLTIELCIIQIRDDVMHNSNKR